MTKKWALFFSGRGSNLEAVLSRFHETWTQAPVLVTNNPEALGVQVAKKFNLPVHIINPKMDYSELSKFLNLNKVECIFLLGYLKIIPSSFLKDWSDRIFNLHPSLLPSYPGLKSVQRAYEDASPIGISIHRVTEGVDQGEVLVQKLLFEPGQYDHLSLEEVTSLVHSSEHQLVCDFISKGEKNIGSKI